MIRIHATNKISGKIAKKVVLNNLCFKVFRILAEGGSVI